MNAPPLRDLPQVLGRPVAADELQDHLALLVRDRSIELPGLAWMRIDATISPSVASM